MPPTMSLKEQQDSAAALRSQLAAGVPTADAVERLAQLQKRYAAHWEEAAGHLRNGRQLSLVVEQVWPPASISAVRAGEESGKVVQVLDNLVQSIKIQRDIRKAAGQMKYPVGILASAIVAFVTIMLTVVPTISLQLHRSVGNYGELKGIAGFGLRAREFLTEHWLGSAIAVIVCGAIVVRWATSPNTIREAVRIVVDLPLVGRALYQLCFGLWARYMAMSCAAGLPTVDALRTTVAVLPEPMQDGVRALIHDLAVRNLSLDQATNVRQLDAADPRQKWPFYVSHAFSIGERSGQLDVELERIAPELIGGGKEDMDQAMAYGYYVAVILSAAMLAGTMVLIYVPMMSGLSNMH